MLLMAGMPFITLAQEQEEVEEAQEEQEEAQRSIAQEESPYQKDVPMEEEASLQAPHDMDDTHLLFKKSKKSQY